MSSLLPAPILGPSSGAYLKLLRTEIARFTRIKSLRHCCSNRRIAPLGILADVLSHAVRTFLRHPWGWRLCSVHLLWWIVPAFVKNSMEKRIRLRWRSAAIKKCRVQSAKFKECVRRCRTAPYTWIPWTPPTKSDDFAGPGQAPG